jgi:hypothetical protein
MDKNVFFRLSTTVSNTQVALLVSLLVVFGVPLWLMLKAITSLGSGVIVDQTVHGSNHITLLCDLHATYDEEYFKTVKRIRNVLSTQLEK